jgi:hypothetical protein
MDEPIAASRRGICYPCLHDERDSPLGPCTVTNRCRSSRFGGESWWGRGDPAIYGTTKADAFQGWAEDASKWDEERRGIGALVSHACSPLLARRKPR